MIVSTSAECSSAIILILPIASAHGLEASYVATQPIRQLCWPTSIAASRHGFHIRTRETEGTQTPIETLNRGWGSCRDLAVLLIEAARSLGFGARVVTGYLYNPSADGHTTAVTGAGTTHAWADIYLPGAGLPTTQRTGRSAATTS